MLADECQVARVPRRRSERHRSSASARSSHRPRSWRIGSRSRRSSAGPLHGFTLQVPRNHSHHLRSNSSSEVRLRYEPALGLGPFIGCPNRRRKDWTNEENSSHESSDTASAHDLRSHKVLSLTGEALTLGAKLRLTRNGSPMEGRSKHQFHGRRPKLCLVTHSFGPARTS